MAKLMRVSRWVLIWGSIFAPGFCVAQIKVHSFEEVTNLRKRTQKDVVIFIYTNWCQYCNVMKSITLKNQAIAKTLSEQFYFVQLNAEEKKDIVFNEHRFKFKPNGVNTGIHELAAALCFGDGESGYPALVILNTKMEITGQHHGLLTPGDLRKILDIHTQ